MSHAATQRPDKHSPERRRGDDHVARFSRGEISRKQAMRLLGDIGYGELLDRLAERRLPLPRLPDEQAEKQSDELGRLLNRAK